MKLSMENSFNKTILLVEDDVIIALGKKNELENYGYNVLTAYTGNKAIAVSEDNNDIDLILMDIDLGPGIDGTIAAEIILKNRDIPVVFMSSHTEPEIIKKTERITSYGYVVKSSIFTVLDASIKMAFKLFDAYKKLNESEERRKEAQRITHLGDWELNLRTGELFWSDEIYRMFDLDPNDFKPDYQAFLANIHPDDREFVNNAYNNSVESKVPYNINHRLLQKNGKVRTVNVRCETFYDDNSIPLRSIGTILDITEQKQMEKDLSEANTIINRSPVV
ncbi:MAG: PAS domain-containing protein, partial [Spirochaetales bacterium]|nr:PAS domain-containing protein [Spirochaetales bacterium]